MISIHNYFGRPVFRDSMAASRVCEQMLNGLNAAIDEAMDTVLGVHSRAHRELGMFPAVPCRPGIAFDEWNVWYRSVHHPEHDLDETFNLMDALTVASLLHVVLRHARTIGLSNISLLVNTLASLKTDRDHVVRQTIWYPQKLVRDTHSGEVVQAVVDAPVFVAKHERFFCGIVDPRKAQDESLPSLLHFDDVPALDVLASVDRRGKKLSLSVVQKLATRALTTRLTFRGIMPRSRRARVSRLTGKSIRAENTLAHPHNVGIVSRMESMGGTFTFPPASFTVLEFEI
jgi:alpha-L-arabinofuranosidase